MLLAVRGERRTEELFGDLPRIFRNMLTATGADSPQT